MCVALMGIDRSLTQLVVTKFPVRDLWVSPILWLLVRYLRQPKIHFGHQLIKSCTEGLLVLQKPIVFLARAHSCHTLTAHSLVFVGMLAALADIAQLPLPLEMHTHG